MMTYPDKENLKENTKHGDILFPMQQYQISFSRLFPMLDMHWHPEMEFTRITEGTAVYSIDLQDYCVKKGDFICVAPNLLHAARINSKGSMTSSSFVFHMNLFSNSSADICSLRYFSPLLDGRLKLPHIISEEDPFYTDINEIFENLTCAYHEKRTGYELDIKALLFRLMKLLITHPQTTRTESEDSHRARLKLIFDYIKMHYAEDISVEEIASQCCISPSHFMHFFKEKSGSTFNQYLNQYRLGQAAILLQKGQDISETAYACGFNNLPYFYRKFREQYHMTPREFQKYIIG